MAVGRRAPGCFIDALPCRQFIDHRRCRANISENRRRGESVGTTWKLTSTSSPSVHRRHARSSVRPFPICQYPGAVVDRFRLLPYINVVVVSNTLVTFCAQQITTMWYPAERGDTDDQEHGTLRSLGEALNYFIYR